MNKTNRMRQLAGLPLLEDAFGSDEMDDMLRMLENDLENHANELKSQKVTSFIKLTAKNFDVDASDEVAEAVKALTAAHKAVSALYDKILTAE